MEADKQQWLGLDTKDPSKARISIMGIPFDGGTSQEAGAADGPSKIKELGAYYMPESCDDGKVVPQDLMHDHGDVIQEPNETWEDYFSRVEDEALEVMRQNNFSLFIGGDHSVTIPLHKAFKRFQEEIKKDGTPKIGIIHFDAHPDLCDCYDGHLWSHANTEKRALDDIVGPEDIAFLGIRAMEGEEVEIYNKYPEIMLHTATQVYRRGWEKCYEKLKDRFKDYDAVYFTLDIDVLDPAFAPGTGTPVSGGITSRELIALVRKMLVELPIRHMDIVEVAPPLDINDITSWAAMRIIEEVFACYID